MIKFSLDDLKSDKLEFGDKFYLPEREKRQNLRADDIAKFDDDKFSHTQHLGRSSK